ncbi:MAG: SAM-dependent methyltransferase [Nitrospirales bacterium]|nr:MAG: SAM-dependent methyltransferase [Nitrospirales bacterium]
MEAGCDVIGIDASAEMVDAAQSRGLNAFVVDARDLPFDSEFDAVFSNATLHWINEPQKVIARVWRALKPSGRFVGEFGGQDNVATIVSAVESTLASRGIIMKNPWFFPSAKEYEELLASSAFAVDSIRLFQRPTSLPGDMASWLETFAQPYIVAVPTLSRKEFISEVVEHLRGTLCNEEGNWIADYVRIRFSARKVDHNIKSSPKNST